MAARPWPLYTLGESLGGQARPRAGLEDPPPPPPSSVSMLDQKSIYTWTLTHPIHFDHENRLNMYLRNIGHTTYNHRGKESLHKDHPSSGFPLYLTEWRGLSGGSCMACYFLASHWQDLLIWAGFCSALCSHYQTFAEWISSKARIDKFLFAARFLRSIFYTLNMEAMGSSETSVPNIPYHIPGDSTLRPHCRENLKSNFIY
jgi:hypothetical protein